MLVRRTIGGRSEEQGDADVAFATITGRVWLHCSPEGIPRERQTRGRERAIVTHQRETDEDIVSSGGRCGVISEDDRRANGRPSRPVSLY